jgi:MFS family permease
MTRGFYIILAAQFFSALADNALLFVAIALLKALHAPAWQTPVLQVFFVFSYIVLAPFVGPFADAMPKGRVMFLANGIKIVGCAAMLTGLNPLLAYGIAGIGAALYSPAKYGILTELLPPEKLVWANGWMEGLTVAAIILGAIMGGYLVGVHFVDFAQTHAPELTFGPGVASGPGYAVLVLLWIYIGASVVNLYIPKVAIDHKLPSRNPLYILRDFAHCLSLLWRDPLGQVSLAVTTLFWGAGAVLRFIVLRWANDTLHFNDTQAAQLSAVTAVGIALGSVLAARAVALNRAVKVLPVGIFMGIAVMLMTLVSDWKVAVGMLIVIGAMGGFFVVPMNALLQHRGHLLMGAGHSIAVQNFNENISILAMNGLYAGMVRGGMDIYSTTIAFGAIVMLSMFVLWRKHGHDQD